MKRIFLIAILAAISVFARDRSVEYNSLAIGDFPDSKVYECHMFDLITSVLQLSNLEMDSTLAVQSIFTSSFRKKGKLSFR
jgi:hypothetical protein